MKPNKHTRLLNRRDFIQTSLVAATGLAATACQLVSPSRAKRTAIDQVALGKTGLRLSRLGFGTGTNSGEVQHSLGKEEFTRLIHYAYDQGITYFDCAQTYKTFEWLGEAIKGLPRERIFVQSKVPGKPEDVLQAIDHHRKVYNTDYVDSMLIHCMVTEDWTDQWKRIMDGFNEAKQKQWILAKGVSCHSLPALRAATASSWTDVHLVRVNPQCSHIDGAEQTWNKSGADIAPVLTEMATMHANGHGVIGMKIIGNGDFTKPEDRDKSIRFAMSRPELSAVVIGFKNTDEIDEAIRRTNQALAEQS